MHILYYDWDEFNGEDCRDAMRRLGHRIEVLRARFDDGSMDKEAYIHLQEKIRRAKDYVDCFDAVFSFDFFPEVSAVCQEQNIPYISIVFDCPHYPLYSEKLKNQVNRVHIFDRALCEDLISKGVQTARHTSLAVNSDRLKEKDYSPGYIHDISFVGNLYDNEFNFYDQAEFPEEIKSYLGDVFEAQQKIFGADILADKRVIDDELMGELHNWISFENTGKFNIDYDKVILDILRKKITILERRNILEELGRHFNTVMYTTPDAKEITGVRNMGLAGYMDEMPRVFHGSKININITMRCILSGIPLRVIDVMGAGGFLLTSYTPEIEENFIDGVDLAIARTPEEMILKAEYYLEHDDERKEIALNGQKKVYEKFAYGKLLQKILI